MDEQVKPAEWVLVPREPTPEMVGAFWRVKNGHHYHDEPPPTDRSDYAAYRAMLTASPSPEASELSNLQKMQSAALTLPPVPGVDREGSSCTETAARGTAVSRPDRPCKSEDE